MLCEDILRKKRRLFQHQNLILSDEQITTYCLVEIEKILSRTGKSLKDFSDLLQPDLEEISHLQNRLIREELNYDLKALKSEHDERKRALNPQQLQVYNCIIDVVSNKKGGVFFVYGHGGTGKTFLYSTIAARLRSEKKVVLTVASSGTQHITSFYIYYF